MSLSFALDELLSTGWSSLDSAGCAYDSDGRAYPTPKRVQHEFDAAGYKLSLTHTPKFNCYRAAWREQGEQHDVGSVVSRSEAEAAVFALAQMRKNQVAAVVA